MKELPILFTAEMVYALLAGKKTMTRRSIKQKTGVCMFCGCSDDNCKICIEKTGDPCYWINVENTICSVCSDLKNTNKAKYQIGDLLWVKETWSEPILFDGFEKDFYYKASYDPTKNRHPLEKWKSSRFMPKKAARIWLKVTGIKVERLQSISAEDSIKEGIKEIWGLGYKHYTASKHLKTKTFEEDCPFLTSQILSFLTLWESINGKESLELNPWVFVYEFEVVSTTGRDAVCM